MVKVADVGKGKNKGTVVITTKNKPNPAAVRAVKQRQQQEKAIMKHVNKGEVMTPSGWKPRAGSVKNPAAGSRQSNRSTSRSKPGTRKR